MTFLKDTKPTAIAPVRQRPTESPRFWLILGGGSIALHIILLLGLRWMSFRASVAVSNANPAPVELIELSPDVPSGEATAPADENVAALPPRENTAPPAPAPPPAPTPEIIAPPSIEPSIAAPVPPAPVPAPPTEVASSPSPTPIAPPPSPIPTQPPSPESIPPEPPASPQPQPPEAGEPNLEASNPGSSSDQSSEVPTPDSGSTSGDQASAQQEQGDSGDSDGGLISSGLPPVPTYEAPSSFAASVSASPPSTDIPQQIAEPIEPSRAFLNDGSETACTATPGVISAWGAPVQFRVRVDRSPDDPSIGRAGQDGVTTLERSGNDEYDALADCLLREWTFRPPDTDAATENEAPSSEVIITVRINPE